MLEFLPVTNPWWARYLFAHINPGYRFIHTRPFSII